MVAHLEFYANRLVKAITGRDEYIFNPANRTAEHMWTGTLSNQFIYCLDMSTDMITVLTDKYMVIWKIDARGERGVDLKQVIEMGANDNSVVTFRKDSAVHTTRVLLLSNGITFDFTKVAIKRYGVIKLGHLLIHVPRAQFNSSKQITIYADQRDRLAHAVLGRPLDAERKEQISINVIEAGNKYKFIVLFSSNNERYVRKTDICDIKALVKCVNSTIQA